VDLPVKAQPWHRLLVERVFQGGPTALPKIALEVGQSEKACNRVLASDWGQRELARYHEARRQVLAQRGVRPLEELGLWAHEAARGLVAAMWIAAEKENARELRESAVAVLAHLGYAPVKKVEKKIEHVIDTCTDPVLLARIISGEVDPDDLPALPPPTQQ
jgi:hypothetical protein